MHNMRIAATTLSGNSESLIRDAIASVRDWVDTILVIDTGITDDTLEIAQTLGGEKLRVEKLAWCNDFAAARNSALQRAAAAGASWALTVDTDERLGFPGMESVDQLRAALEAKTEVLVWLVASRDGSYSKERFIRLPTHLTWQGRVHEALVGATASQRGTLAGVSFFEVPKTREQFLAKARRDLEVLKVETQRKPEVARWWYYLGQTWEVLEEPRQAVEAYRRCYELHQWAEQGAWACFRAPTCSLKLREVGRALEICSLGIGTVIAQSFSRRKRRQCDLHLHCIFLTNRSTTSGSNDSKQPAQQRSTAISPMTAAMLNHPPRPARPRPRGRCGRD